ncbi:non-homologous end-joining DNA ligase [Pararhizobium sp. BT-229]|uniref:non-homologous end-joining DNA ligase n=1 Tax=Pararhizobium sp. BT-229 TaxID=2986923 RepID=UPI0021F7A1A5|nr:non-homologous end-joining DNA ligase [Pararhizobium sp. BT-229]MCV9965438.1 non-homologous end-joining DNA ligase [Pararhizobium sp. BT-229]
MVRRPSKPPVGLHSEKEAPLNSRANRPRDPDQPQLPFDPMPSRIEPCLALLASKPPKGSEWAFEVKWDGYRLAVHVEPTQIRILTRGGHDWTKRFSGIARAAKQLGAATMILDGEAVVLDEQGRSDFGALQAALGGRGGKRNAEAVVFYAFDLLYFDGHDLRRMELSERRHLLESILPEAQGGPIRLSEEVDADGDRFFQIACEHGLEGIIAKHRRRPYRSGRQGDWLKIKCVQSESFAIVGYEPSTDGGSIASLLLAAIKGDELFYVGSVGTGFKEKVARDLKQALDALAIHKPTIKYPRKQAVVVRPELVAEVEFRNWTKDGKLRHTSFKGIRLPQDNPTVYRIES